MAMPNVQAISFQTSDNNNQLLMVAEKFRDLTVESEAKFSATGSLHLKGARGDVSHKMQCFKVQK